MGIYFPKELGIESGADKQALSSLTQNFLFFNIFIGV